MVENYRGFTLRIFTVGAFVEYTVLKGADDFLAGHTPANSETEQQVLSRLKARMDSESLGPRFSRFTASPNEGKGRL